MRIVQRLAGGTLVVGLILTPVVRAAVLNMPGDALGLWAGGCTQTETQVHTTIVAQITQLSDG